MQGFQNGLSRLRNSTARRGVGTKKRQKLVTVQTLVRNFNVRRIGAVPVDLKETGETLRKKGHGKLKEDLGRNSCWVIRKRKGRPVFNSRDRPGSPKGGAISSKTRKKGGTKHKGKKRENRAKAIINGQEGKQGTAANNPGKINNNNE